MHPRPGELVGQRERDRAGPRTQVHTDRPGPAAQLLDRPADDRLRFRPRYEHAGTDQKRAVPEAGETGQMLERDARGAGVDQLGQPPGGRHGDGPDQRQPAAGDGQDVRGELLGVGTRAGHPGGVQRPDGGGERTGQPHLGRGRRAPLPRAGGAPGVHAHHD
jgi:hypothetical protein